MAGGRSLARRGTPAAAFLCLLALASPAPAAPADGEPALTNVDVVRMVMSDVPVEEILDRIRSSPAEFDIEPDMLVELERAGVPPRVIDAMVAKAREQGKGEPAPPASGPVPQGTLEIIFEKDPQKDAPGNSVVTPARTVPFEREEGKVLLPGEGPPEPVRLAFVLTCAEATHVPDHWRGKSPIGSRVGRHRLIFFEEATREIEGDSGLVYLEHPDSWSVPMDAGHHQGHLGVAVAVGERDDYLELFVVPYEDLEIADGKTTRLTLRMSSPESKRRGRRGFMRDARSRNDPRAALRMLTDPRLKPSIVVVGIAPPSPGKPDRDPD